MGLFETVVSASVVSMAACEFIARMGPPPASSRACSPLRRSLRSSLRQSLRLWPGVFARISRSRSRSKCSMRSRLAGAPMVEQDSEVRAADFAIVGEIAYATRRSAG